MFPCAYIRCMYASVSDVTSINAIVQFYIFTAELKTKKQTIIYWFNPVLGFPACSKLETCVSNIWLLGINSARSAHV